MDMITLAMAKAYTNSQRLASVEPAKVFTYDGGEDAEFEEVGGTRLVKLADGVFDLNKVKNIKCVMANTGTVLEYSRDELTLVGPTDGLIYLEATYYSRTMPAVFTTVDGGLYGFSNMQMGYLSYIEFAETVHPIDPKFLPGVCLPVVELSTTFSTGAWFTDAENELLTEAHAKNVPLVIKCNMNLGNSGVFENTAAVWSPVISGGIKVFVLSMGGIVLQIGDVLKDGKWVCSAL